MRWSIPGHGDLSVNNAALWLARKRRATFVAALYPKLECDETAHLTDLVADLAGADHTCITCRLWLEDEQSRRADVVLIDSPPARGRHTRRALVEADYVLIPAPPERIEQMEIKRRPVYSRTHSDALFDTVASLALEALVP